jgi:hypothetical protein
MAIYRIRLTGDRPYAQYVDVEAKYEWEATRIALANHRNALSAKCMGLTAELESRGACFRRAP